MARVLLLLPTATYRARDFMRAAVAMEVEVVVGSEHRQALANSMGDRAIVVPLTDPDRAVAEIVALHQRFPLDAVVGVDDQGILIGAMAGSRLGLVHNRPSAVAATRDKRAMRDRFASAGVAQPDYRVVLAPEDAGTVALEVGFPCVVKPPGLSASRGVIRADDAPGAQAAVARIRAILADAGEDSEAPLLVERYIPGEEVAIEGLLSGGHLEVLAIFDKPDPLTGPFFEETLYVTPSRLPAARQEAVAHIVAQAASALGLTEGPVHAECRVDGERVVVLEVAARSIGGLCSRTLRFGLGVSLEEIILGHALGRPFGHLEPQTAASGVMMLPIPAAGILDGVHGQEQAGAVAGVSGLEISATLGRRIVPLPEGDRYLGFLFAQGDAPSEVEDALRQAHACLTVVIDGRAYPGP